MSHIIVVPAEVRKNQRDRVKEVTSPVFLLKKNLNS